VEEHVATPTAIRLAADLVAGTEAHAIEPELRTWLTASPRFRAFAVQHAAKLHKKLRGASDADALRDVRLELLVARSLLGERRIELAWEPFGARQGGPDFTVTLPGARVTTLEVTRLRRPAALVEPGVPWLAKLHQLPPGVPNVLVVGIDGPRASALDVAASVRQVRARADARDEAFLAARGFADGRAFYERFLRLGAVIVFAEEAVDGERATEWRNGSARIAVPAPVLGACLAGLRAGG
jgi:hypothetical protein